MPQMGWEMHEDIGRWVGDANEAFPAIAATAEKLGVVVEEVNAQIAAMRAAAMSGTCLVIPPGCCRAGGVVGVVVVISFDDGCLACIV